jgi:hypothetical protein
VTYTMPITHADLATHPKAGRAPLEKWTTVSSDGRVVSLGYSRLLVPDESTAFRYEQRPIRANYATVGRGCGMTLTSMLEVERDAGADHFARLLGTCE